MHESPTGWWFGSALFETSDPACSRYWNNSYLIKAKYVEEAFERLTRIGAREESVSEEAFSQGVTYLGVSNLVPLYEEIGDGAEILWEEFDDFSPTDGKTFPRDVFSLEEVMAALGESPNSNEEITRENRSEIASNASKTKNNE